MSNLLYLPGILVVLFKRRGAFATARHLMVMLLVQGLLGSPFLVEYPWEYIAGAFDLSRVFLYKWTVNWRFVDEATFLRPGWSKGLLIGHSCTLIIFGLFRWCREDGGVAQVLKKGFRAPFAPAAIAPITPNCEPALVKACILSDV
jgi:alpha-1,3-mannosyltransferase